jgi:hypothetical protein
MAATGWKRPFADPIPLPGGRQLVTLEDAAGYIMKLPKAEQNLGEWQAAIECLILVAEKNGPTMMARIGMMKAPCRGRVRVPPGRHRLDEPRHRLPRPRPGAQRIDGRTIDVDDDHLQVGWCGPTQPLVAGEFDVEGAVA